MSDPNVAKVQTEMLALLSTQLDPAQKENIVSVVWFTVAVNRRIYLV